MTPPAPDASSPSWDEALLQAIATADDLRVAPRRPPGGNRGGVPGTPTWIWSVAVDGGLYVRPYRAGQSSWYESAVTTNVGIIDAGGERHEVVFEPADEGILERVDAAYHEKYAGSAYLPAMLSSGPRACTLRVTPR